MKRKNNIDQNQGIVNKKIKIQANRQSDFDMGAFAGHNAGLNRLNTATRLFPKKKKTNQKEQKRKFPQPKFNDPTEKTKTYEYKRGWRDGYNQFVDENDPNETFLIRVKLNEEDKIVPDSVITLPEQIEFKEESITEESINKNLGSYQKEIKEFLQVMQVIVDNEIEENNQELKEFIEKMISDISFEGKDTKENEKNHNSQYGLGTNIAVFSFNEKNGDSVFGEISELVNIVSEFDFTA